MSVPNIPSSTNNSLYMGPIKNQGSLDICGDCAITSLREWYLKKQGVGSFTQLSSLATAYWNSKVSPATGENGVMTVARQYGFAPNSLWDENNQANYNVQPPMSVVDAAAVYRVGQPDVEIGGCNTNDQYDPSNVYQMWKTDNPNGYSLSDFMAQYLAWGHPLYISIVEGTGDGSFNTPKKDAYGNWVVSVGGPNAHNVVLMDYKPDPVNSGKKLFKFQNSWGTAYPPIGDGSGCAWFNEAYINTPGNISEALCLMGNPLARYKFQIGPFTSALAAATAGNALVAKGYSLDSTMFQTAHNTGDQWYLTCSGGWTTPGNAYSAGNAFASNNGYSVGAQPITVAADKTYGETNGHLKSQLYCWTEMYWPPVNTIGICSIDATLFVDNAPLIGQYINFSVFSKNQNKVINTFQIVTGADGNARTQINSATADTLTVTVSYTDKYGQYITDQVVLVFH